MERTWTQVGEEETQGKRTRYARMIERLKWQALPLKKVGMMPAECIKTAIRELRLPKVSHIAITNEAAPYGLYGIRAHYSNGMAQVYILDRGSDALPIASDFEEATVSVAPGALALAGGGPVSPALRGGV